MRDERLLSSRCEYHVDNVVSTQVSIYHNYLSIYIECVIYEKLIERNW